MMMMARQVALRSIQSSRTCGLRFPAQSFASLFDSVGSSPRAKVEALFTAIDTNNDGVLSLDEVIAHAESLSMSADDAAKLFKQLDYNGDGVLSKDEFVEIEATDLTSFKGLQAFLAVNNPFATAPPATAEGPLGRWSVGVDKMEAGGKNYDHSS